jgi:hypothetical protein
VTEALADRITSLDSSLLGFLAIGKLTAIVITIAHTLPYSIDALLIDRRAIETWDY